jgi:hypothetical protein
VQWRDPDDPEPSLQTSRAGVPFAAAAAPPQTPDVAALLGAAELVTPQPGAGAPTMAQARLGNAATAAAPPPPQDLFQSEFGILRYASAEAAERAVAAFDGNGELFCFGFFGVMGWSFGGGGAVGWRAAPLYCGDQRLGG